ncbi:MAG: T9SS type A sorting domain-containing protein [Calditrichota bacterium]
MRIKLLTGFLGLFFVVGIGNADTLRIATYNALNLRGSSIAGRIAAFRTVMASLQPDLITLQEVQDEEAVDQFLSFVLLPLQADWASAPYNSSSYNDNAFFYRSSKVSLLGQRDIPTTLRDITEYLLRPQSGDTTLRVRVYSLHLKANAGSGDNIERRRQEALILRQQLDQTPAGSLLLVCGDYNILYSDEPAYQLLLAPTPSLNGQLFDPINTPGHWESTVAFAAVHTIGTDGLNARFDFILVSSAMMDTVGSHILPESYWAYGNDGQHFGRAVNDLPNNAVPDSVADALYNATDHLPVVADFVLCSEDVNSTEPPRVEPVDFTISAYPNPFNAATRISYDLPKSGQVSLSVFNLQGQMVATLVDGFQSAGAYSIPFDGSTLASGVYLYRLQTEGFVQTRKMVLLK